MGTVGDGWRRLETVGDGWRRDGDGGVTVGDGTVTVTVMDGDTKGQGSEELLYLFCYFFVERHRVVCFSVDY